MLFPHDSQMHMCTVHMHVVLLCTSTTSISLEPDEILVALSPKVFLPLTPTFWRSNLIADLST